MAGPRAECDFVVGGQAKVALFERGLLTAGQHGFNLPRAVYDRHYLNRLTFTEINNDVRVYGPEPMPSAREQWSSMAETRVSSELYKCFPKLRYHLVCPIFAIVGNVIPDLEDVRFGLGSE
jgi:hypothetical protein